MLKIMIRVTSVDLYGFCGRDQHPEASDEGQTGLVLRISTDQPLEPAGSDPSQEEADAVGGRDLSEDYPGQRIAGPDFDTRDREGFDEPQPLQLVVCKLANGRTVELLGHEFELLSAAHDGDIGFSEVL